MTIENLLRNASSEIVSLRRQNEILAAKVEMIDLFSLVFNTKPAYPSHRAGEDVVWMLDRQVREIEAAAAAEPSGEKR